MIVTREQTTGINGYSLTEAKKKLWDNDGDATGNYYGTSENSWLDITAGFGDGVLQKQPRNV